MSAECKNKKISENHVEKKMKSWIALWPRNKGKKRYPCRKIVEKAMTHSRQ